MENILIKFVNDTYYYKFYDVCHLIVEMTGNYDEYIRNSIKNNIFDTKILEYMLKNNYSTKTMLEFQSWEYLLQHGDIDKIECLIKYNADIPVLLELFP